ILITVEGDLSESDTAKGTYTIENFDTRVFTVNISNRVGNSVDVKIFDRFGLIYEGSYIPTILINNNGNLYMEEPRITFTNSGGDTFYEDYKISYSHIVSTALRDNVYMRGNWVFLLYATLVISILIIDINWPLFLFNMRYGHAVKKAEPSDRYLAAQKISRIIYPIVAIIFLIASLS
ncbi:MAG TPA: hypothetical protein GX731_10190, partial [Clostridiales bacterium]|nr:hypothetical protein [Clostridiales bacterium]